VRKVLKGCNCKLIGPSLFLPNPDIRRERKENGENRERKRGKEKRIDGRERKGIKLERRAKPKVAEGRSKEK